MTAEGYWGAALRRLNTHTKKKGGFKAWAKKPWTLNTQKRKGFRVLPKIDALLSVFASTRNGHDAIRRVRAQFQLAGHITTAKDEWLAKLKEVRAANNILASDECAWVTGGASGTTCSEHFGFDM